MNIISVRNLEKTFTQHKRPSGLWNSIKSLFHRETFEINAVKNVNFEIKEGEFVGFVGPNGAGKTTTLKMLSGILYPTKGEVTVAGHIPWERAEEFQKKFSLVMGQKNQLWWDLPVEESFEFNRVVYSIPRDQYEKQKNMLIELLDLSNVLEVPVRKLSLGERMKAELGASLLHRPKILFLDEPTIGLDIVSQKKIREFLAEYNRVEKATIILTSHYMEDIRRLCERVIIIDHGRILYDGTYRELIENHADTKTIEMNFNAHVPQEILSKYGTVTEYRDGFARLSVRRQKVPEITTMLLNDLPVEDISIHEQSMEEVVSEIFQGGDV